MRVGGILPTSVPCSSFKSSEFATKCATHKKYGWGEQKNIKAAVRISHDETFCKLKEEYS